MSQDIKIQNKCDHRIFKELGSLNVDRRSIVVKYPIGSALKVNLYINGALINKKDYIVKTLVNEQDRIPVRELELKRIRREYNPIIEVDYFTIAERCPKCLGVKILDDMKFDGDGNVTLIKDEAYLLQQVEKFIVTRLGSNKFHDWMGTSLQDLVGTKITDIDIVNTRIREQVESAIDKLIQVQSRQISIGKKMTSGELYGKTLEISVEETEDISIVEVYVSFTARSGKTIEYSQYLEFNKLRQRLNV